MDVSDGLSSIDQIGSALDSVAQQFQVSLADAIDSVSGASVSVDADASTITSSIEDAVSAGDGTTVAVQADSTEITTSIEDAVNTASVDPIVIPVDDTEVVDATSAVSDLASATDESGSSATGASGSFSGLAAKLGTVGGAGALASGELGGVAGSLEGVAASAGPPGLALGALAGVFGVVLHASSEQQVVTAQTDNVLRNLGSSAGVTGSHMEELALRIEKYSGFSHVAVQEGENLALSFTNVRNRGSGLNAVFDRVIVDAADVARKMGGDVPAAARILARAIDNPTAGLSRLKRANIQLTDAQTEEIKQLQAQGDLLGAQKALLSDVEAKVGGAARAYGQTLPGQLDILRQSLTDTAEALGTDLTPAVTTLASDLVPLASALTTAAHAETVFFSALGSGGHAGGAVARTAGGFIAGLATSVTDLLVPGLGSAASSLASYSHGADHGSAASEAFANHLKHQLSPAAQEAAAQLDAFVQGAVTQLPQFSDSVQAVDKAGEAFGRVDAASDPKVLERNIFAQIAAIRNFTANLKQLADEPLTFSFISQLGPTLGGGLAASLAKATPQVQAAFERMLAVGQVSINEFTDLVRAHGGDVQAAFTDLARNGLAALDTLPPGARAAGERSGAAHASGVRSTVGINRQSGQIVAQQGLSGFGQPNFGPAGATHGAQAASGIRSQGGAARSAGSALVGAAVGSLLSGGGRAHSAGSSIGANFGQGIADGIGGAANAAINAAVNVVAQAQAAANAHINANSPSRLTRDTIGKPFGEGIAVGIASMTPSVVREAENITKAAVRSAAAPALTANVSASGAGGGSGPVVININQTVAKGQTPAVTKAHSQAATDGALDALAKRQISAVARRG